MVLTNDFRQKMHNIIWTIIILPEYYLGSLGGPNRPSCNPNNLGNHKDIHLDIVDHMGTAGGRHRKYGNILSYSWNLLHISYNIIGTNSKRDLHTKIKRASYFIVQNGKSVQDFFYSAWRVTIQCAMHCIKNFHSYA